MNLRMMIARSLRKLFSRILYPQGKMTHAGKVTIHKSARIINMQSQIGAIHAGNGTHIKGELVVFAHNGQIVIGRDCYIGENARIWSASKISIGDRVLIAHEVNVFDNNTHPVSAKSRHQHYKEIVSSGFPKEHDYSLNERPVAILNDAWVGARAIIMPGCTIGEGAIVGAGSVVTTDVAPYTIVAGNPARLIREIPADER
jgi:acetyltransferase-like isoleucine patch superfamily enzyme